MQLHTSSRTHKTVCMPSRIQHPRLNRLIFSRLGWSTCFISVLPAPLGAPQLCSVLWVCRVIFPEHASNTWVHKRWRDLWRFTAARRNVQAAPSAMWVNRQLFSPPCNYSVANVQKHRFRGCFTVMQTKGRSINHSSEANYSNDLQAVPCSDFL